MLLQRVEEQREPFVAPEGNFLEAISEQNVAKLMRQGVVEIVGCVATDVDLAKLNASFAAAG